MLTRRLQLTGLLSPIEILNAYILDIALNLVDAVFALTAWTSSLGSTYHNRHGRLWVDELLVGDLCYIPSISGLLGPHLWTHFLLTILLVIHSEPFDQCLWLHPLVYTQIDRAIFSCFLEVLEQGRNGAISFFIVLFIYVVCWFFNRTDNLLWRDLILLVGWCFEGYRAI